MKKRLLAAVMAAVMGLTLTGCGGSGQSTGGDAVQAETEDGVERKEYTVVYSAELAHINYLKSSLSTCTRFTENIVDALVDFDRYGVTIPSLAESWEVSDDQLTYTFHLREGVNWYTCDGEEYAPVTAQDFVDAARWLLNPDNASTTSNIFYNVIKNAEEYYNGEITDFDQVGIHAVDEHTVEYTLYRPTPYFLTMTAYSCFLPANGKFLEECGDAFGTSAETMLSCGAYILTTFEPESRRVLEMNENYWDKDNIFISRINYNYNKEAKTLAPELFLRGEVTEADIPAEILDEWMEDEERKNMMIMKPSSTSSNFLGFNFEPLYDEEYGPENWKKAVNNENFRKSLFHALDREAAIMTVEPYDPQSKLLNTFTRRELVQADGVDYTMMGGLAAYTEGDSFDAEKAVEYKEKAMEELAGSVTFPIQILLPFSTSKVDTANRMQVIEQQMEGVLGTDYIDIILESHPSTGFSKQVRNPGAYSMMELGWGSDFADPLGMMNPVHTAALDGSYMRVSMAEDLQDENGNNIFEAALDEANKETKDLKKRYEMFAEAECMLLDHAILIPFYTSGGGYRASYLDPFSGYTSQMGRNGAVKLKGAVILDKPMGMSEYPAALEQYEKDREERMKE